MTEELPERVRERFPEHNFIVFDGYGDAIIGVTTNYHSEPRLVYDREKIISQIMKEDGIAKRLRYLQAEDDEDYEKPSKPSQYETKSTADKLVPENEGDE